MGKENRTAALERYIAEIDRFATLLRDSQQSIAALEHDQAEKKEAYEGAKSAVKEARDVEHATVSLLLRFVRPGSPEVLPLFDTMQPAVEKTHGAGAKQWRKEPIAVLGLSGLAMSALIAADVVLVGQLQDLMLADPEEWYGEIDGISQGMAEAIAAKFAAYVAERTAA